MSSFLHKEETEHRGPGERGYKEHVPFGPFSQGQQSG